MTMRLLTLHDILVVWQAGEIGYRRAMELAQIDTLDDLYEAAHDSRVPISNNLSSDEKAMASIVADLIRGQARLKAACVTSQAAASGGGGPTGTANTLGGAGPQERLVRRGRLLVRTRSGFRVTAEETNVALEAARLDRD